ncbi:hypothetical protein Sango_0666700 [Sesamum angolense]|uniref:Integrase catalytic domain-containing protein n=1 Tax=Sesamum angolense TaxID=2727404 RepID=A0AAE1X839_9LAMI|nr:hypothetical protein Sango_0666700 [Sesamum angolense]
MSAEWELSDDLPDENVLVIEVTPPWKMYFDGASHKEGVGAGVVFVTSEGEVLPYSFTLTQNCSNNVAEYQTLILGLDIAVDAKQLPLKVYRDSQLVVNQLLDLYEVKKPELLPYHNYAKDWTETTLPHKENYWPTMVKDCIDYARRCQACQFHANLIHQPLEPLHPTIASWPFDAWGCCGTFDEVLECHLYILAARDYFSKYAEAVPLKEVKKENIADFIHTHIIYRYGVPRYIITDNGKPICNSLIDKLCQKFGFKQRNSSMYYVAANGVAEAFNKTLCNLLKVVSQSVIGTRGSKKLYGHTGPLLEHLLKQLLTH